MDSLGNNQTVLKIATEAAMKSSDSPASPDASFSSALTMHLESIRRVSVDDRFAYDSGSLLDEKLRSMANDCSLVLDVGQSVRDRFDFFQPQRIETVNINGDEPPPDIIDDICDPGRLEFGRYDGIVCLSVLEHVYDPFAAMHSLYRLLKPGGRLLLHVPFIYRYHAPPGLEFTDSYRFSRDGLAWMLRDFDAVVLYPVRGPYSSIFNLFRCWKKFIERRFGTRPNRLVDGIGNRIARRPTGHLQVSGYYAWARKPG